VVLPGGITGAQVAAQARALRPELRVLFTTGYAGDAVVHLGRLDKGVHLITKPFSFPDLAAKVRRRIVNGFGFKSGVKILQRRIWFYFAHEFKYITGRVELSFDLPVL